MEERRREVVVVVVVKRKRISTMLQEGGVSEEGGGNNGGALKLLYQFLRSFYEYLLVPPFLKLPCPQTMVSVAFSSPNDALGVQTMPQNFTYLFQLCIKTFLHT